jgi:Alr-MurF fusion protein
VKEKHFFHDVTSFIHSDVFETLRNEVILIKGARRFGFDNITELLVKKVHETILEVNLSNVVKNLNFYRSFMRPETKLVCMIKADAYGAGAVEIAKTLQDHRVDYLAVAVADEGVTLRKNGITSNIMIMNPEMSAFKTMFDYDLEPEVYSFRLLDALVGAGNSSQVNVSADRVGNAYRIILRFILSGLLAIARDHHCSSNYCKIHKFVFHTF